MKARVAFSSRRCRALIVVSTSGTPRVVWSGSWHCGLFTRVFSEDVLLEREVDCEELMATDMKLMDGC